MDRDFVLSQARDSVWLDSAVYRLITQGRSRDFSDLSRAADARLFNYSEKPGYRLIVRFCSDKNVLVREQNGPFPRSSRAHLEDSNRSRELSVRDRVPTFFKDREIVIPVLDWLYGLIFENGEYTWRSLNRSAFQFIRQNRINDTDMTRFAIANTYELIFGHISDADAEEVITAMRDGAKSDNTWIPKCALSLDTESIKMYDSDWYYMCEKSTCDHATTLPKFPNQAKGVKNRLAFIIFGNGSTWNVILRFPYVGEAKNSDDNICADHFKLRFMKRPLDSGSKRILRYLSSMSVAYGCDIFRDLQEIRDTLWDIYKHPWNPPKALDIASMFVTAGYDENHHNMALMSYLLLGVVMNKRVSEMNNLWAFKLGDLERRDPGLGALWYVFNDIKCGFNMMAVLFNWLFFEAFPDPATVLLSIRTDEDNWRTLFLLALAKTIGDRSPNFDSLERAQLTRLHRMYTLTGYSKRFPNDRTEIDLINNLYDLFPCVPHGTLGGPRYIEGVREQFALSAVPSLVILFGDELKAGKCIVRLNAPETETPEWIFRTMLGHQSNPKLTYFQPGTQKPGLTAHPELRGLVANFNSVGNLKEVSHERDLRTYLRERVGIPCSAGKQNYDVPLTIREGGFHTPERLPVILEDMEREYDENVEARKEGRTNFEVIPNLAKHTVIKRVYKSLTGEDIGSVAWEDMKVDRATKMVDNQRNAVKNDPLREQRVDVMEAALQEMESSKIPLPADPMRLIAQNIPIPRKRKQRNMGNNRRKKARAKAKRAAEGLKDNISAVRITPFSACLHVRQEVASKLGDPNARAPLSHPHLMPGLCAPEPSCDVSAREQVLVNSVIDYAYAEECTEEQARSTNDALSNDNVVKYLRFNVLEEASVRRLGEVRAHLRKFLDDLDPTNQAGVSEIQREYTCSGGLPPTRNCDLPTRSPSSYSRCARRLSSPARPARRKVKVFATGAVHDVYYDFDSCDHDTRRSAKDPRADSPELF